MISQDEDRLAKGPFVATKEHVVVRPATPPPNAPSSVKDNLQRPDYPSPTLAIPDDSRSSRRRPRADSSVAGSPSSGRSLPSLSPDSPRSGSPFGRDELPEDGASIYACYDRGYTAAEERYRSPALEDLDLPDLSQTLEESIRGSLCPYGGDELSERRWLPLDKLFGLVNKDSVSRELSRVLVDEYPDKIDEYANTVCEMVPYQDPNGREETSSRRFLFAILTLMGKTACVPKVLKTGLLDKDLPLKKRAAAKSSQNQAPSSTNEEEKLPIAMGWDDRECDLFLTYQKYMLSPFFKLEWANVPFYDLDPRVVLPFIEKGRPKEDSQGHQGTVWRVKIHPAHHDKHEDGRNPYFAVKYIYSEDSIDVKEEVRSWAMSVGVKGHDHLINLLAGWVQGRNWFLLFPWAPANLRQFWKEHSVPERTPSLVQWVASECQGIAQALRMIHRNDSDRLKAGGNENSDFGIHSDIKPENILWFESQDGYGTLVICDFGFTRFHRRQSRSIAQRAGGTDTYRGPETDLTGQISRKYDIWALACLYLEFITWYLMGFEGVQNEFADARIRGDDRYPVATDKFFYCPSSTDSPIRSSAIVKPSVLEWVRQLRRHEHCSQYLHDFLDLIVNRLLVINPKGRETCDFIGVELRKLREKCDAPGGVGEAYCFTGKPRHITEDQDPVDNAPHDFRSTEVFQHAIPCSAERSTNRDLTRASNSGSSSEGQSPTREIRARIDGMTADGRNTYEESVPNQASTESDPLLGTDHRTTTNLSSQKSNGIGVVSDLDSSWACCCLQ